MARMLGWVAAGLGLAFLVGCLASCGGEPLGGAIPPGTGGATSGGGGGTSGTAGSIQPGGPYAPGACGVVETVDIQPPANPDILILMDRSASMNDDADGTPCGGGCGPTSKFVMLLESIDELVATKGGVNWGLMFFGADDACGVSSTPQVPIGAMTAPAIENALADATPGGEAPTAAAIPAAVTYLQSLRDLGPRYILLVTDGKSGCASDPSGVDGAAETAVANATIAGVPTFVLAIAPPSDPSTRDVLNLLAASGGVAAPLPTAFYTPGSIGAALPQPTVTPVDPCTISVNVPAAGTSLAVYGARAVGYDLPIPQDPVNGWEYTDSSLTVISLNGTSCDDTKNGTYTQIVVDYQCDMPGAGLVKGHTHADGR